MKATVVADTKDKAPGAQRAPSAIPLCSQSWLSMSLLTSPSSQSSDQSLPEAYRDLSRRRICTRTRAFVTLTNKAEGREAYTVPAADKRTRAIPDVKDTPYGCRCFHKLLSDLMLSLGIARKVHARKSSITLQNSHRCARCKKCGNNNGHALSKPYFESGKSLERGFGSCSCRSRGSGSIVANVSQYSVLVCSFRSF